MLAMKNKFPMLRTTILADAHLNKIIKALKRQGQSVSKTSFITSLILAQPIPTMTTIKAHIIGQDEPVQVKVKAAEIELSVEQVEVK